MPGLLIPKALALFLSFNPDGSIDNRHDKGQYQFERLPFHIQRNLIKQDDGLIEMIPSCTKLMDSDMLEYDEEGLNPKERLMKPLRNYVRNIVRFDTLCGECYGGGEITDHYYNRARLSRECRLDDAYKACGDAYEFEWQFRKATHGFQQACAVEHLTQNIEVDDPQSKQSLNHLRQIHKMVKQKQMRESRDAVVEDENE